MNIYSSAQPAKPQAQRHQGGKQSCEENRTEAQQLGARSSDVGKEGRQQQGVARAENPEHPADDGVSEPDLHESCFFPLAGEFGVDGLDEDLKRLGSDQR